MNNKTPFTTYVLWAVYISLLIVLLPHTAWAFANWEPGSKEATVLYGSFTTSDLIAYIAAFSFEASIATLTHKLSKKIEITKKITKEIKTDAGIKRVTDQWGTWKARYMNGFSLLLVGATMISMMANFAHAVEFAGDLKIFTDWGIPPIIYSIAFGAALPLVSLGFANVLSNVTDDEEQPNPELEQAKATILGVRQQLRDAEARIKETELRVKAAEEKARIAEDRYGAMGDLVNHLFGEDKRQRIIIARKQWPDLPGSAIAVIAGSSPAYVSEVFKEMSSN